MARTDVETSMVDITAEGVHIDLVVDDPVLTELLSAHPREEHPRVVERALAVGVRGLLQLGVGINLSEVDEQVRRSVARATAEAEERVDALLRQAERTMAASLDPEQRSSMIARAMSDFVEWRDGFLRVVDPEVASSHTGRLVGHLRGLLGPGGALEERLKEALDPGSDGSGLARLSASIDRRFAELRDMLAERRGKDLEADRGTAKGFDFEDAVEDALRRVARSLGAVVERTSTLPGGLGSDALVGDYLVTLPSGARVVVEAKNVRSISLTGTGGILAELDRALANRTADVAVCVSAGAAFPAEVGPFGAYGKRLLVVDDGEGTMLWVAMRWAAALAESGRERVAEIDLAAVADKLDRLGQMSTLFSTNKKALTEVTGSIEKVRLSIESMRRQLMELVDDLAAEVLRGPGAEVVDMRRQAAG